MLVHSLCLILNDGIIGWIDPTELNIPHGWVGFRPILTYVVPVDAQRNLSNEYDCELVDFNVSNVITKVKLIKQESGLFLLDFVFNDKKIEFEVVRNHCYRHLGKMEHPDFQYELMEIRPTNENLLEELYNYNGMIVLGADVDNYEQKKSED